MSAVEQAVDLVVATVNDLIVDHPMWEGIDYSADREARLAEFVHDVAEGIVKALGLVEEVAGLPVTPAPSGHPNPVAWPIRDHARLVTPWREVTP